MGNGVQGGIEQSTWIGSARVKGYNLKMGGRVRFTGETLDLKLRFR